MSSILDSLNSTAPALWLEVSPPRGINPAPLLKRLAELAGHVDAINLTDNAMGKVKMSGLVFGAAIKERLKIPVVLNVSCRDRNRFALKSDLLGAAAIGIDGLVALNGDKIPPGADGKVVVSHDIDAYGLLAMVAALNRGDTGEGKAPLRALPSLVAGSVANPNRKNIEREFELLARKAAAGAHFVITQPIFDAETGRRFVAKASSLGILTMLGILEEKGFVRREADGRGHRYFALVPEKAARQSAVRHLVRKFFRGSSELLFTHLVSEQKLSPAQAKRLRQLLQELTDEERL